MNDNEGDRKGQRDFPFERVYFFSVLFFEKKKRNSIGGEESND